MEKEHILLKKLREQNGLSLSEAAKRLGKGKSWLSEVENNKGKSALRAKDYEYIYAFYNGDKYRRYFGSWIKEALSSKPRKGFLLNGAIYKFLRCEKAKLSLENASKKVAISKGYLSKIENGKKDPTKKLKEALLNAYGYNSKSWEKIVIRDKIRGGSIPTQYKLNILLKNLEEEQLQKVLEFVLSLSTREKN